MRVVIGSKGIGCRTSIDILSGGRSEAGMSGIRVVTIQSRFMGWKRLGEKAVGEIVRVVVVVVEEVLWCLLSRQRLEGRRIGKRWRNRGRKYLQRPTAKFREFEAEAG